MGWRLKGGVSCGSFTAKQSESRVHAVHIHQFLIHCPKGKYVYSVKGRIFHAFDGFSGNANDD